MLGSRSRAAAPSLNDMVGSSQKERRDLEIERLGSFRVDDKLELGGLCATEG